MKKMKWAAMISVMVMAVNVYAQVVKNAAEQAKQMQVQLKLTDMQTAKLTAVLQQIDKEQENDKATQANFKNWQATRNVKAVINYMIKQMDANAFKIERILTPEQDKTFKEMFGKRRDALQKMADSQK